MALEEILRYENAGISYGDRKIIEGISFSLKRGEILGIAGASGCGKSSLIKAAFGILDPSATFTGKIIYKDMDLSRLSGRERRRINGKNIAMIFQDTKSSLSPVRTVGKQMYEALRSHEKIAVSDFKKKAVNILEKLKFSDPEAILYSYPFELSGGMQQRVGIAMAFLPKPDIIFADEPTSALDVCSQKQVIDELLLMREIYDTSIVMVSHNKKVLGVMTDNILKL